MGVPVRDGARCSPVLLLDLNGFKMVNDTYGHHVGDQPLQQVARRLESCVRAVDLVARMSGDEFNVLLESIDPAEATHRAQQIAAALAAPYVIGEHTVSSGASIGLVSSASRLATVDDYLRAADTAMYRQKPVVRRVRASIKVSFHLNHPAVVASGLAVLQHCLRAPDTK